MRSFLDVSPGSPFSIHNLPYGVFTRRGHADPRVGVALGEQVIDLAVLAERGLLDLPELGGHRPFHADALNDLMALDRRAQQALRARLQRLLRTDEAALRDDAETCALALVPQREARMRLPARIGDYTDFYASRQHATNVGAMFRGRENALMPNWLHLPVGYHGRASSVVVSGTDVMRPHGQTRPNPDAPPTFGPAAQLDFELELGFYVGAGNRMGEPIPVAEAPEHLFGFCLVNDWSARDIQRWEYVPLGPFLAKSFATSVSPWVVPYEALTPFRVEGEPQRGDNPEPLPYLRQAEPRALDLTLEVFLETEQMRADGIAPHRIARTNARNLYWSPEQQLAHHTVGGCPMRPGDLLASGTISGDAPDSYGSLLELTWRGERPIALPTGETRTFLRDGDRVLMTGYGEGADEDGPFRVGFGGVEGTVCLSRSITA